MSAKIGGCALPTTEAQFEAVAWRKAQAVVSTLTCRVDDDADSHADESQHLLVYRFGESSVVRINQSANRFSRLAGVARASQQIRLAFPDAPLMRL
jgi:hypothetical protein